MNEQPEALRLADEFDWWVSRGITIEPRLYDAAAELRRLHAENEALRKDAERYRWLRESKCPMAVVSEDCLVLGMSYMDAAIDAAMKGQP